MSINLLNFIFILIMCVGICHTIHVEVRGQAKGVSLYTCETQESNSGHQT